MAVLNMPVQTIGGPSPYADQLAELYKNKNQGVVAPPDAVDPLSPEEAAQINALGPAPGTTLASMSNPLSDTRKANLSPGQLRDAMGQAYPDERGSSVGAGLPNAYGAGPGGSHIPWRNEPVSPLEKRQDQESLGGPTGNAVFAPEPTAAPKQSVASAMGAAGAAALPPPNERTKKIEEAYDKEQDATRRLGEAEIAQNKNDAHYARIRAAEGEIQEEDILKKAKHRESWLADQSAKIADLSEKASNLQVDPNRYFKNSSTTQDIFFTLAAALSGAANGFNRSNGPNLGIEAMNNAINHDIDAQKVAIDQAHGKVEGARGVLADAHKRFGNMEQAEAAARIAAWSRIDASAKAMALSANSASTLAKYDVLAAKIEQEREKERIKFDEFYDKLHARKGAGGAGVGAVKPAELHSISKDREDNKIPDLEMSIEAQRKIIEENGGVAPGSSYAGRVGRAIAHANIPLISTAAEQLRGQDARGYDANVALAAEAMMPKGMRSAGVLHRQEEILHGNYSPEAAAAALALQQRRLREIKADTYAGHDPAAVQEWERRFEKGRGTGSDEAPPSPKLLPMSGGK